MSNESIQLDHVRAVEANLRVFENHLIEFREFMRTSQGFTGDWREAALWKKCRRSFRLFDASATAVFSKRHRKK